MGKIQKLIFNVIPPYSSLFNIIRKKLKVEINNNKASVGII